MCISSIVSDDASNDSSKMNRHLELIDDEALLYGVKMVKIDDPLMSKKYGHRQPPGLGLFRKGDYIKFEGSIVVAKIWNQAQRVYFKNRPLFCMQAICLTKRKCLSG